MRQRIVLISITLTILSFLIYLYFAPLLPEKETIYIGDLGNGLRGAYVSEEGSVLKLQKTIKRFFNKCHTKTSRYFGTIEFCE